MYKFNLVEQEHLYDLCEAKWKQEVEKAEKFSFMTSHLTRFESDVSHWTTDFRCDRTDFEDGEFCWIVLFLVFILVFL